MSPFAIYLLTFVAFIVGVMVGDFNSDEKARKNK